MTTLPTNLPPQADAPEPDAVRKAVTAVRRGDPDGFAPIVGLFGRRVHALCLTVLRDPAVAEDVAQDAFVKAYLNLDRFDPTRPFFPWIATIAIRLAFNSLKKRQQSQMGHAAYGQEYPTASHGTVTPLTQLVTGEDSRRLWQAVGHLPHSQRAAVHLFYREDMVVTDVARSLGVSTGTVKTLLFRARQRLRADLADIGTSDQETMI